MTIKGIIFDMDGVLMDSEPYFLDCRYEFLHQQGAKTTYADLKPYIGQSLATKWSDFFPNLSLRDQQNLQQSYDDFKKTKRLDYQAVLNPQALPLLKYLYQAGYVMGLASASQPRYLQEMLRITGLTPYFEVVLSGRDFEHSKPAPDIYQAALAKLNLAANSVLAVEDSTPGIQAARAAHLQTLALVQTDERVAMDQSQATYKINELKDILNYL